jgi:tetratricopeptide (TPR) repeat protein
MLTSMTTIRDCLRQVESHQKDTRWLSQHEDKLHTVVAGSIYRQSEFHDAVEILMMVFPHYALELCHQKWSTTLVSALVQAQDLRDNEIQIRILTQLGEGYITWGKNTLSREAFSIALERAREGQFKAMMLAAYIGLIRMQSVSMGDTYDPDLLSKALTLSREIDDLTLKAALHQSLLLAYLHTRETVAAIEHGQIAYIYSHHLGNRLEMAKTLYLLSAAYRFAWLLERAEGILQFAAEKFEKTDYNRQYAFLAYDAAALHLLNKEYNDAAQWSTIALSEAINIDIPYLITASHHALGIAQTGLGQYQEAEQNLKYAIKGWEKLNNYYELVSAHQAMGNLDNKRREPENALLWLQKALELCMKTPPSSHRTWLESHIRETIEEIPW